MKRLFLIVAGWFAVTLGAIGIFLPLLPTTPFLILAATCFAKSSERFHTWLLNSPLFGPIIRDWLERRCIDPIVKRWAMFVVLATFSLSIALVQYTPARYFLVVLMIICLIGIYRLPVKQDY